MYVQLGPRALLYFSVHLPFLPHNVDHHLTSCHVSREVETGADTAIRETSAGVGRLPFPHLLLHLLL